MYFYFRKLAVLVATLLPSITIAAPLQDVASCSRNDPRGQTKIQLFWLEQSRSQRVVWLLEELQLEYEILIFHRDEKTKQAGPELKQIHALGKFPVISITTPTSSRPIVIAESGVIIEYLLKHFSCDSRLLPEQYKPNQNGLVGGETEEWMRYKYFMQYAEGSLMPLLMIGVISKQIRETPAQFPTKTIIQDVSTNINTKFLLPNLHTHFTFLEQQLLTSPNGGGYLCGPRLTGADVMMSFPLIAARNAPSLGMTAIKYPLLNAYVKRLEQEWGYIKAAKEIFHIEGKFKATL